MTNKEAAWTVCPGVDLSVIEFDDYVMVRLSEVGCRGLGTLVLVTPSSDVGAMDNDARLPDVETQVLLGDREDPHVSLWASQLSRVLLISFARPLLLSLSFRPAFLANNDQLRQVIAGITHISVKDIEIPAASDLSPSNQV